MFERCLRTRIALEGPMNLDHIDKNDTLEPRDSNLDSQPQLEAKDKRVNSDYRDSMIKSETPQVPESIANLHSTHMPGKESFQLGKQPSKRETISVDGLVASTDSPVPGKTTMQVTAEFSVKKTGMDQPVRSPEDVEIKSFRNLFKH